jgi:hypothetical protein
MLLLSIIRLFLASAVVCSAQPLEARQSTSSFNLYAYGEGISGLPVFYKDGISLPQLTFIIKGGLIVVSFIGTAQVVDSSKVDTSPMTQVYCKPHLLPPTTKDSDIHIYKLILF